MIRGRECLLEGERYKQHSCKHVGSANERSLRRASVYKSKYGIDFRGNRDCRSAKESNLACLQRREEIIKAPEPRAADHVLLGATVAWLLILCDQLSP